MDNWTAEQLKALAPHKSVFNLDSPRAISRNLSIPKPVVATIANWLHEPMETREVNSDKLQRMAELPDA